MYIVHTRLCIMYNGKSLNLITSEVMHKIYFFLILCLRQNEEEKEPRET